MSKAEDKKRAIRGEPFRNQSLPEGKVRIKCLFPPCQATQIVDKAPDLTQPQAVPPFCDKHRQLLEFMMWILPHIEIKKQETPSGIVLPGSKKFGIVNPPGDVKL